MKKKMTSIICSIFLVMCFLNTIYSHSHSQAGYIDSNQIVKADGSLPYGSRSYVGGEDMGWSICEEYHMNNISGTTLKYYIAFSNDKFIQYVVDGVSKWNSVVKFVRTTNESEANIVFSLITMPNNLSIMAQTLRGSSNPDSNGHISKITIELNKNEYDDILPIVIAHEVGHTFGLNDLYLSKNKDKIMYGTADMKATAPTPSDVKGFNVITGLHVTHVWVDHGTYAQCALCDGIHTHSRYITSWYDYDAYCHKGKCSACGETITEPHSAQWNSSKQRCERCGHTGSIIVTGKAHLQQTPSPAQ